MALGSIPGDDQDFSFFSFAFFQTPLGEKVLSSLCESSELDNNIIIIINYIITITYSF